MLSIAILINFLEARSRQKLTKSKSAIALYLTLKQFTALVAANLDLRLEKTAQRKNHGTNYSFSASIRSSTLV